MEEVLSLQNPHWQGRLYPHLMHRLCFSHLKKALSLKEIHILLGVRRSGKSTLFKLLMNHLMIDVEARSIVYVNLDDPFYAELWQDAKKLYTILEFAEKITGVKPRYLFLDEIQNVSYWERFVKSVYDSELVKKLFITGSNSSLLKGNYAKLLSGRYVATQIFPLSFKEILFANQIEDSIQLLTNKAKALATTEEMLLYGSFPEVYKTTDHALKRELLSSYYETILLKDCVANHNVREIKLLQHVVNYLLTNNGAVFSYNSLARAVNSNENTVRNFIHIIEDSFLMDEIKQFSFSLKIPARSKKKNYCIDNGLVHVAATNFSQNKGRLFEGLVYSELKKQGFQNIYFFNDDNECDFIVKCGLSLMAFQVCYALNTQNRDREIKGLRMTMQKFSISQGHIITFEQEEKIDENIQVVSFWKYFFGNFHLNN